MIKYRLFIKKRKIEAVLIYPFIILGRLLAKLHPLAKDYSAYLFFPFYHTGGAEKVHYTISQAVGSREMLIVFTKRSLNDNYFAEFERSGCDIIDISTKTDNKWFFFINLIYRGKFAAHIKNQKKRPLVFNGQSNFAYKLSPWIGRKIHQIELIHAFNTFAFIRLPFLEFYTLSITVGKAVLRDYYKQYDQHCVPGTAKERFIYIENKISIPKGENFYTKYHDDTLNILYVGRGTREKRVHLVAKIAERLYKKNIRCQFLFAGDVKNSIPAYLHQYCIFLGDISESKLNEVYERSHILLITSSTESGPFVFMEAMARGLCVISTLVGYVQDHMKIGENGLLLSPIDNEHAIVENGVNHIEHLNIHRGLLNKIGNNSLIYARKHFDVDVFKQQYKDIFTRYIGN